MNFSLFSAQKSALLDKKPALLLLPFVGFLALALISYIDTRVALWVCAFWCVLVGLWNKEAIFLLSLCLIPFGQIFAFLPEHMQQLTTIALTVGGARYVIYYLHHPLPKLHDSNAALILAAYGVLVAAHFEAISQKEIMGSGLLCVMMLFFFATQLLYVSSQRFLHLFVNMLIGSVLCAATISVLYLYVPLPWLVNTANMPDNLRLVGVFEGTNAGARFLLLPFCFFLLKVIESPKIFSHWLVWLLLTSCFVATTGTKSALGSSIMVCILAFAIVPAAFKKRVCIVGLLVLAMYTAWILKISPWVEYTAASNWQHFSTQKLHTYLDKPPSETTVREAIDNNLRIGKSRVMSMTDKGKVLYVEQPYNIMNTGQRVRIWRAGLDTIADHPFWGIGFKNWSKEMMARLSYPFRSPHNGLMEVTGAMGVLGAVLYVLLAVLIVRRFVHACRLTIASWNPLLAWASLSIMGVFALEIVDANTSLSVTFSAVWFWALLSLQEAMLSRLPEQ